MYPYGSSGYSSGRSSRYQEQQPRGPSQTFDDDLPMYVLREDTLQPQYSTHSQAAYYAPSQHYEANPARRYYGEGQDQSRMSYQDPYYSRHTVTATVYPERPGEQKCSFYMRTGKCSYGPNCKFDHPAWVPQEGISGWKEEEGEFPQRPGQPHCAYFMKNGTCKFGSTCKFDHPGAPKAAARLSAGVPASRSDIFGTTAPLNSKGLPLRPTEPLCEFFKKTGACKYGVLCKYDHPEGGSAKRKREADPNDDLQDVPLYAVLPGSSYSTPASFPQRPGQPDCQYYLRTGSCQYGPTCKYHHPLVRKTAEVPKPKTAKTSPPAELTPAGLPRRPGATLCSYYMKTGLCKYAPDCKFDHPPPGEAAKMAYRAAAAEKSAPVSQPTSGGSSEAPALHPAHEERTPEKIEVVNAPPVQGEQSAERNGAVHEPEQHLTLGEGLSEAAAGFEGQESAEGGGNAGEGAVAEKDGDEAPGEAQQELANEEQQHEGEEQEQANAEQQLGDPVYEELPVEELGNAPANGQHEEPTHEERSIEEAPADGHPAQEIQGDQQHMAEVGGEQPPRDEADFVDAEGTVEDAVAGEGTLSHGSPKQENGHGFDLNVEATDAVGNK